MNYDKTHHIYYWSMIYSPYTFNEDQPKSGSSQLKSLGSPLQISVWDIIAHPRFHQTLKLEISQISTLNAFIHTWDPWPYCLFQLFEYDPMFDPCKIRSDKVLTSASYTKYTVQHNNKLNSNTSWQKGPFYYIKIKVYPIY